MSSDEGESLIPVDEDQDDIKKELSQMSFEDLQTLKEKVGSKVYNETIFGKKKILKNEFKRENKNRPREMSAKKQVPRIIESFNSIKKPIETRDPRFDSLCGEFNEKAFKNAYSFLNDIKQKDVEKLKKELKNTDDPKRIKKIKYLIQRLENQLREETRKKKKEEAKIIDKQNIVDALKKGEKPQFKKKSEQKVLDLVSQYEELKSTGKLKKHINRLKKKRAGNDKKRFAQDNVQI
ncbi:hypothetical protein HCN44_000631 [Aphidius gifuensis]|uniref:rRNA biogenesis protein RRP36 n=1 Tax=Aphidius gifuensis TaxID=684658 RepID=A0A834XU35_APHGI|nr:ribosomal RNA processing protein 36 homolog [Aphidius gifuensis]KAF7990826.1 hypothetical protein HCN44_000631 [Aphidius gifuensis]